MNSIKQFLFFLVAIFAIEGLAQDDLGYRSALADFRKAQSGTQESYAAAALISLYKSLDMSEVVLTEDEKKSLQEAEGQITASTVRLKKLYDVFTPADVKAITASNPDSVYRLFKKFNLYIPYGECTTDLFEKLKKKVDISELYYRGHMAGPFLTALEAPYIKTYNQAILELLKTDARFKDYQDLGQTVFNPQVIAQVRKKAGFPDSKFDEISLKEASRLERRLIDAGVAEDKVSRYSVEMVQKSPECLGGASMIATHKFIKRDFAVKQVNRFAERLKGAELTERDFQFDGLKRFVEEKSEYLRNDRDSWGHSLELLREGSKLYVVSKGPDSKSAEDDIRSNPVDVKVEVK